VHSYLEAVPTLGEQKALEAVAEQYRERCDQIQLDGLPLDPTIYKAEMAYAFDVETGKSRWLGQGLKRNYGTLTATEIPCTLDVVGSLGLGDGLGLASVEDYKAEGYESFTRAPLDNEQLLFGALCLDRLDGGAASEYELALQHIRPDGSHWREGAPRRVDCFDLDAFAQRLRKTVDRVRRAEEQYYAGKTLNVSRGPWCRYCPATVHCPAVIALIHAAASKPEATLAELRADWAAGSTGALEVRRAAAAVAFQRLNELKAGMKELSTALWQFASENDIVLPDGRVYGAVDRPEDKLEAREVRKLLAEKFSTDVADLSCTFDTSKAAVERALKGVWAKKVALWKEAKALGKVEEKKPTLAAMMREVLGELQKAGGMKTRVKRQTRLHRKAEDGQVVIDVASSSEEEVPF
jgi:hypothetical protein